MTEAGALPERERRTAPVVAAICVTVAVAIWQAPEGDWNLALLGILLAFSVFSDLTAVRVAPPASPIP